MYVKVDFKFLGGKMKKLSEVKVGGKAKVVNLQVSDKQVRRHLLDMGLTRGTIVEIKKIAPMGDPVDIKLRDYELCIRREELKNIEVEMI